MTMKSESLRNISSLQKQYCFGCGVCQSVCPVSCIVMFPDHEGFLYPVVNEDICIDCGACVNSCPGFNAASIHEPLDAPIFYGGYLEDDEVRYESSSGGIFSLIARHIITQQGTVYGAYFDYSNMTVVHGRASSLDALEPMRKSKYVQSSTHAVFKQVKEDLAANIPVLFTGTPCQVEGLYLYLGETYDNLFTCDIICHGVPSPVLFNNHFRAIENKLGELIKKIDFRTKEKGWGSFLNFYLKVETTSRVILTYAPMDAYYALFLANLSLRPCCYECRYTTLERKSDLTIGDFWGVQKHTPDLFDGKGTSLILVNTDKGQRLLGSCLDRGRIQEITEIDPMPPNLFRPTDRPPYRDKIFKRINLELWSKYRLRAHLIAVLILLKVKVLVAIKQLLNRG